MEIKNIQTQTITGSTQIKSSQETKPNDQVTLGEIKGQILDIGHKDITIKNELGKIIKGSFLELGSVEIGDIKNFMLSMEGNELLIALKDSNTEAINNFLNTALKDYELKATKENLEVIENLLDNNFPITKENITNLGLALKLLGKENINESLFFLKNNMKVNEKNVDLLKSFTSGNYKITDNIKDLLQSLNEIPDISVKENIFNVLENTNKLLSQKGTDLVKSLLELQPKTQELRNNILDIITKENITFEQAKAIGEKILIDNPNKKPDFVEIFTDFKEIENLVKDMTLKTIEQSKEGLKQPLNLKEIVQNKDIFKGFDLEALKKVVQKLVQEPLRKDIDFNNLKNKFFTTKGGLEIEHVDEFIENLKENINHIKNNIPKNLIDDFATVLKNTVKLEKSLDFFVNVKNEIFFQLPFNLNNSEQTSEIFVFKDRRSKKKTGAGVSALVALDTVNLGRFETYIQKNEKNLYLQFRLKDKETENLVKAHINQLNESLKKFELKITGIGYKTQEEAFNVTDNEPMGKIEPLKQETNMLSFDLRA